MKLAEIFFSEEGTNADLVKSEDKIDIRIFSNINTKLSSEFIKNYTWIPISKNLIISLSSIFSKDV